MFTERKVNRSMEISINGWITIACYTCLILCYIVSAVIKVVSDKKNGKESSVVQLSSIETIINEFIPSAIEEAEKSGMVGFAKKMYVVSKIICECASKGVSYDANAKLFDECIERLVSLTKKVNTGTVVDHHSVLR